MRSDSGWSLCSSGGYRNGAVRQQRDQLADERLQPGAGARADREDLPVDAQVRRLGQRRNGARAVEPIDLVERGDGAHAGVPDGVGDEAVAGADLLLAVEHEQRDVGVAERALDAALHALGERVARTLDAGQVDEHELPLLPGRDAADLAPGGLRLVRDDGHLAADDPVDQCRLARVGAAGERHEAGARHSRSSTRRWSASISPPSVSWS